MPETSYSYFLHNFKMSHMCQTHASGITVIHCTNLQEYLTQTLQQYVSTKLIVLSLTSINHVSPHQAPQFLACAVALATLCYTMTSTSWQDPFTALFTTPH